MFGSDPRRYQTTVKEFLADENGSVRAAVLISLRPEKDEATGRLRMVPVEGSEEEIPADLVLIAAGFTGCETYSADTFGVALNPRGNVDAAPDSCATSVPRVFAAGDMRRGQSLVVWAIAEGEAAAKAIDKSLMGYTNL